MHSLNPLFGRKDDQFTLSGKTSLRRYGSQMLFLLHGRVSLLNEEGVKTHYTKQRVIKQCLI